MKKQLESQLVSLAHRVLKSHNRAELEQLYNESKKLYELLSVLYFYETNIHQIQPEISKEVIEEKLAQAAVVNSVINQEKLAIKEEEITSLKLEEEAKTTVFSSEEEKETFKDLDFVRVEDTTKAPPQKTETTLFETANEAELVQADIQQKEEKSVPVVAPVTNQTTNETVKTASLNDRLTQKNITLGLNDRIAFEKSLFNGNADDLNRVLSQLNTFTSFDDATAFISSFVKPDYNNWEGKEDYEARFLEIIEKKFN